MMRKQVVIFVSFVIFLAVSSLNALGQESKVELKDKRITIQMTQKPLYTVFWRLIQKYDVAIGFEQSVLDRDHRHYEFETNVGSEKWRLEYNKDELPPVILFNEHLITVNFKNARLEDVMNAIVKQMENYAWEITDEVVNIFPIRGRDERLKKLLDLKVRSFAVGIDAPINNIQAELMLFLPEFKAFLAENKLEADASRPANGFEGRSIPDGMGFSNMTFKELLNAITKSKRGGWMLQIKKQKDQPSKEFVEILI